MKKKRKIKIPAAAYGTAVNSEMAGLVAYNNGVAYNPLLSSINNAPTPSIPNMPTKSIGAGMNIGNMVGMAGDTVDLLSNPFKKSTATSSGEAVMQSVADIGKGASIGLMVGGPAGAIVGAGIGAIGSKGEKATMENFVEYKKGTIGKGVIGALTNRGLRKEELRIKTNAYNNRAAVQGTNDLDNRYGLEYGDMNTNTYAVGGVVPSSLAYVDDGELIQTPDGSINQVPEMGQPLDSNLVSLPEGTRILSNKLKAPGTKKTFSELGEQMMTKRMSKGKDKFAENSNMLNERNNKMIHDQLFDLQEQVKAKKGIKNKTKPLETFLDGGVKSRKGTLRVGDKRYNLGEEFSYNGRTYRVTGTNKATPLQIGPLPFEEIPMNYLVTPETIFNKPIQQNGTPLNTRGTTTIPTTGRGLNKPITSSTNVALPELSTDILDFVNEDIDLAPTINDIVTNRSIPRTGNEGSTTSNPDSNNINYGDIVSDISALTPIMSNMFTKNEKGVNAVTNPYANAITRTMRGRRFDIDPAIEDITRNRAISNYNTGQINTNTGANLAYRLQSAVNTDRAIANLRSQESNANNQYLGDYANTMNSLGQQYVGAVNMANEANAQNRANTRNIRRTGASQFSQWAQNRQLMRNQRNRDNAMMELYAPFLKAGFTSQDMSNFSKYLRKGGNYAV